MINRIIPAFKFLFTKEPAMSKDQTEALQQTKVFLRESVQRDFRMDQQRMDKIYSNFSSAFWPTQSS